MSLSVCELETAFVLVWWLEFRRVLFLSAVLVLFAGSGSSVAAVAVAVLSRTVPSLEIGRAACRERGWTGVLAGGVRGEEVMVCRGRQVVGGAVGAVRWEKLLQVCAAARG